jgi:uncharacterized membrane protein
MQSIRRCSWCVFTIAFFVAGDMSHFTWWTLISFAVWLALSEFGLHHHLTRILYAISLNVIAGVCIMSLKECAVLVSAHAKYGDVAYMVLNFAVHYLPLIVLFTSLPTGQSTRHACTDILFGLCLFWVYLGMYDPERVYGCDTVPGYVMIEGSLLTSLVLIIWEILCHQ